MVNRSTFVAPNYEIDSFIELYDLPPSQVSNAQRYQYLKTKTNLTTDEQIELNNLTTILQNYIIDPEKWNKFCDAIVNMETFIKSNVEGYISTKQVEFQAEIDKFTYKGEYNSTTQYYKKNIVTYNGESYLCLQDCINQLPTNTIYWSKIAQKGEKGEQGIPGVGLNYKGTFSITTNYTVNDLVTYNGNTFYCIADTVNRYPGATGSEAYWVLFMSGNQIEISNVEPTLPIINKIWIDTTI